MALTRQDRPLGPPWSTPLRGSVDTLVVHSDALADNPLRDPAQRPLYVYRAPGVSARAPGRGAEPDDVPVVFVLQSYLNQVDRWFNREVFELNVFERLDARFTDGSTPPAVIVFVDAWTSLGGSQFIDSPALGRYGTYLREEIVPFVESAYPVRGDRSGRGLAGHSSGGYGAAVNAMLAPELFGAFSSRAGDALFDVSLAADFPAAAKILRDHFDGSLDAFLAAFAARDRHDRFSYAHFGTVLTMYAAAASFSPDRDGRPELPFDVRTGAIIPEVFARWLERDPVRMARHHADALRSLRYIHLEAGRGDEANLDLGNQAFSDVLAELQIPHRFELFDGGHGGQGHRLPGAIAEMVRALAAG